MITDLRTIPNFFFTHTKLVTNLSLFEGSRRTPQSNLWTTPEMGFVRDEMNKRYELNRGVRRLLTRCGLHKFHWSWWGWFNFSCTKRERTNDWATRTRGFVMERECKSIFLGCAKKVKVLTTIINNIQLLCRESILTCSKMDWAILWSCDQTKVGVIQKHFTSAHVLSYLVFMRQGPNILYLPLERGIRTEACFSFSICL